MADMPNDALGAVAELAAPQHGVITRSRAAQVGFTARDVARYRARGLLTEPVPGVLSFVDAPDTWPKQAWEVLAAIGARGVLSHRAAAHLHGLDGFTNPPRVEVTVERGVRRRVDALVHHTLCLPRADRFTIDDMAVTGLARTLCDLGSVVGADEVLRALDDARRREVSTRWIRHTAERLHRPGQRGTGVLLAWLDQIERDPVIPGSWFNRLLERCLASPRLPRIEREYVLVDPDGGFVARFDLAMPEIKLAVEGHSRRHHLGVGPESADEARDIEVAACGWEVLYLGWQAHLAPERLLSRIERVAASRRGICAAQ